MNPSIQESATPSSTVKSNKFIIIISALISLIVIVLIFITLLLLEVVDFSKLTRDNDTTTSTNLSSTTSSQSTTDNILNVSSPKLNDTVDGMIVIAGKATNSLGELEAKAYDDNNNEIGTATALLNKDDTAVQNWSVELNVIKSPETTEGKLKIYPKSEGDTSILTKEVNVKFYTTQSERLKIISPIRNQLLKGTSVKLSGEMKDVFEATMSVRLIDDNGAVLLTESLTATDDNYGKFAPFEKNINYGLLTGSNGSKGKWEFYEISAMDGSEKVLGTVDVRFKE